MIMDFEPPKPRSKYMKENRPQKDSFQRELDSVIKKRNSQYSSNDFSDDDGLGMDDDVPPLHPSSSKSDRFLKTSLDPMPKSPRSGRAAMEPNHLSPRSPGRSSNETLDKSPRSNYMSSTSSWQPAELRGGSSGSKWQPGDGRGGPSGSSWQPGDGRGGSGATWQPGDGRGGSSGSSWQPGDGRGGSTGSSWQPGDGRGGSSGSPWQPGDGRGGSSGSPWQPGDGRGGSSGSSWQPGDGRGGPSGSSWQPGDRRGGSSGSSPSPRKSPTAEQVIFGEKGTLKKRDYKEPAATWAPPSYKKVNFQPSPREEDEEGDSDGPATMDLGRTARHGTMDALMRSQRQPAPLENDDEGDSMQLRRPSAMKKKPLASDGTFGKTDNRRKSALLGLDAEKEEEEEEPKGRPNFMKGRKKPDEAMPQPPQRKISDRQRKVSGSPPPRASSRTPSPTKEPDASPQRTSVLDFMKGPPPPVERERRESPPPPAARNRRASGKGAPPRGGSRDSERSEAASPKPLDFSGRRSPEKERGSLFEMLGEKEGKGRSSSGDRRSPSPVERKAPKPRARPKNDLLSQASSTDRGVLRRSQKVVEQSGDSSSDSSVEEAPKRRTRSPKAKEPPTLPEPRRKTSKAPPLADDQSSICEELERDPMSVAKDEMKKETKLRQREKEIAFQSDENKAMYSAINAVADEQDRDGENVTATTAKKKKSGTGRFNVSPKVSTRPSTAITENGDGANFNDSQSLRQAVYDNWYREKMGLAKTKMLEEKKAQKEAEERKKEEEKEKMAEKMATFNCWVERKQEYFDKKAKEKKREEKRKKEKEEEEKEKEKNAEKTFKMWKERKDSCIQEQAKTQRRSEHQKRVDEFDEKKKKQKESETAFESWKKNKDSKIKEAVRTSRRTSKEVIKTKEEEEKEKDEKARIAFEEWEKKQMERKLQREDIEKRKEMLSENRRPWRPSSATVVKRR